MTDIIKPAVNNDNIPQCQYFVVRKKRLCRMTVRPGRQYCGEHEPDPRTAEGKDDTRIPCPNDPKHTCYASKLEKHLTICNARQTESPPYIMHNVNVPHYEVKSQRKPLSEVPAETVRQVIDKVNRLYEKHIINKVIEAPERSIHPAVLPEFLEEDRGESSRRHLRQASRLLQLAEDAGLVRDGTCYVELGAGKGQLSYYMWCAWCASCTSSVLLVDRAALRHKRDNKLRARTERLRADLAHVRLSRVPAVASAGRVVGFAKHLCGVATDYALHCLTSEQTLPKTAGLVLATCCHHRCDLASYVAITHLQELGITEDEFNVILGIVSWATCGDGRSRERRQKDTAEEKLIEEHQENLSEIPLENQKLNLPNVKPLTGENQLSEVTSESQSSKVILEQQQNNVTLEKKLSKVTLEKQSSEVTLENQLSEVTLENQSSDLTLQNHLSEGTLENQPGDSQKHNQIEDSDANSSTTDVERRAEHGRRAKLLLDWGRVLYLQSHGLNARLCRYVPSTVSPENICIIATLPDS